LLHVVVPLTFGGDTDEDGSDREFDSINRDHHNAAEVESCLKTISTERFLPRFFFIFSQFVVYSMLSSNKERKNGVATFVFE